MDRFIRTVTLQKFTGEASTMTSLASSVSRMAGTSSAMAQRPRSGPGSVVHPTVRAELYLAIKEVDLLDLGALGPGRGKHLIHGRLHNAAPAIRSYDSGDLHGGPPSRVLQ